VDRLARSLRVLLGTHTALTALGVSIKLATEPLDTSTPFGTFLFQLLGSMLEKSTILERTALGRHRIAKAGRWTGGHVPFGYAVQDGYLVPHPEHAQVVREVFERVAGGSTLMADRARLTQLTGKRWSESTLSFMLKNRT
jgi:site-specific DNA recombinase